MVFLKPAFTFLHLTTKQKKTKHQNWAFVWLLSFIWSKVHFREPRGSLDVPVMDLFTSGMERGLLKRHTLHLYLNKHFILNAIWFFFFTPYLHNRKTKLKAAHWPGKGLCLPAFGQWRGFREEKQPSIRKGGATEERSYADASMVHSLARWPVLPQL